MSCYKYLSHLTTYHLISQLTISQLTISQLTISQLTISQLTISQLTISFHNLPSHLPSHSDIVIEEKSFDQSERCKFIHHLFFQTSITIYEVIHHLIYHLIHEIRISSEEEEKETKKSVSSR